MDKRRPGSKALVMLDHKFILVQRDNKPEILNPNKWNLPGGGIDEDETPIEALIRELREEIDLVPTTIEPMGTTTYLDGGAIVYRFAVRCTKEEYETIRLVSEGQKLGWFTQKEALELDLSPHLRAYLTECADDINETLTGKTKERDWVCKTRIE